MLVPLLISATSLVLHPAHTVRPHGVCAVTMMATEAPERWPRETDSHYELRTGCVVPPVAEPVAVVGESPEQVLAGWGCDAAFMVGLPFGARKDLTRFATTGNEEMAKNRIATMKEVAAIAYKGMEPGTVWEKEAWDTAVLTWETAEAAKLADAIAAEKEAKKAKAKAAREAAAAAKEAAAAK